VVKNIDNKCKCFIIINHICLIVPFCNQPYLPFNLYFRGIFNSEDSLTTDHLLFYVILLKSTHLFSYYIFPFWILLSTPVFRKGLLPCPFLPYTSYEPYNISLVHPPTSLLIFLIHTIVGWWHDDHVASSHASASACCTCWHHIWFSKVVLHNLVILHNLVVHYCPNILQTHMPIPWTQDQIFVR
jgi:hypothetical protein